MIGATGTYNGAVVTFDSTQTVGSPDYCLFPSSPYVFDYLGTVLVAGGTPYNFFNGAEDTTVDRILNPSTAANDELSDPEISLTLTPVVCS